MSGSAGKAFIILTDFELNQKYKARLESFGLRVISLKKDNSREVDIDRVEVMIFRGAPDVKKYPDLLPLRGAKGLKLFQSLSAGIDQLDLSQFPQQTVVCSNVGAYAEPMAESVFAFVLSFAKNIPSLQDELAHGRFPRSSQGTFLKGKTIGVIGAGGTGRAIARLAKALGMKVLGIASKPRDLENFDFLGTLDDLDYLLRESDVVVISIPLTIRTRGLINSQKLKLMKKNAILANVARGPIVVEKDLYQHLKENPEFRAGIDVWWKYPKEDERFRPDYPFTSLKNVLVTPHTSAIVPEVKEMAVESAVENVARFLAGLTPKGVVNRSDYGF